MGVLIDNVELDSSNKEFDYAIQLVESGVPLLFLTGKAGTGKTFFLKYISSISHKNKIILAPTGVAAINAGGQTINSFFHLPFSPFRPDDNKLIGDNIFQTFRYNSLKRNLIENLELLIIDEVSMVRCDTLDIIDLILRKFRNNLKPFGGVQVVLIGDAFQIPPVIKEYSNEWNILSALYATRFFFSSKIYLEFLENKKHAIVELKKIYSQKEQDFIDILNRIRVNQVLAADLETLHQKYKKALPPSIDNYIVLSTTNQKVNHINASKLEELKTGKRYYEGNLVGEFPKDASGEYILPTNFVLELKEEAQVMMLKNATDYYNGKIGTIKSLSDEQIVVVFPERENDDIIVQKASWDNIEYSWDTENNVIIEIKKGTFTQYPLKLAWAITVHKSQGLRFPKVVADVGNAFEAGQVYVALSRCTSLSGLILKSIIPRNAIFADPHVIEFSRHVTPETLIVEKINSGKADSLYKMARQALRESKATESFDYFLEAIKSRNDIETANFKRFIIVTLNRFYSIQKHISELLKLKSLEDAFILLHEENKLLREKETEHGLEIQHQNKSLKILFDKVQELELLNNQNSTTITELYSKKRLLEESSFSIMSRLKEKELYVISHSEQIDILRKEVDSQLKIIEQISHSSNLYLKEIEQLKKRKWHQYLFRR